VLATPWFLATQCACGFEALADEQVIDHVLAVFEYADAVGTDGKTHEEMAKGACSCGFSVSIHGAGNWRQLMAGSGGSQGFPSMALRTASSAVVPWAAAESR
jgi:hypothetical protein